MCEPGVLFRHPTCTASDKITSATDPDQITNQMDDFPHRVHHDARGGTDVPPARPRSCGVRSGLGDLQQPDVGVPCGHLQPTHALAHLPDGYPRGAVALAAALQWCAPLVVSEFQLLLVRGR